MTYQAAFVTNRREDFVDGVFAHRAQPCVEGREDVALPSGDRFQLCEQFKHLV